MVGTRNIKQEYRWEQEHKTGIQVGTGTYKTGLQLGTGTFKTGIWLEPGT